MENKSREDINLSPVSKIEISFILDNLAPIASNYQQSYSNKDQLDQYIRLRHILKSFVKSINEMPSSKYIQL